MKKIYLLILALIISVTGCSVQSEDPDASIIRTETNEDILEESSDAQKSPESESVNSLIFIQAEMNSLYSESGYGLYNDLVRQVFSIYDIPVSFVSIEKDKLESELSLDTYFGIPGCAQNISKYKNSLFTNNFYASSYRVYYAEISDPLHGEYKGIDSLYGLKIGINPDCDPFKNVSYSKLDTYPYSSFQSGVEALKEGQIDLLIYDALAEAGTIDETIKYYSNSFATRYHSVRVWTEYPEASHYIDLFDKGLKTLIEDGRYYELIEKYGLEQPPANLFTVQYDRKPVEIGYPEFPPYEYTETDGLPSGIIIETVKESLALAGFGLDDYVLKPIPWERLMDMGYNGEVDMVIEGLKTEERAKHLHFSNESIFELDFDMAVRDDSGLKYDGEMFNKDVAYIGAVRGYDYGENIYRKIDTLGLEIKIEPSTIELINGFKNGRYDLILEDENVVRYYLKEVGMDSYSIYELNSDGHDSYIFYPKSRDILWLRDLVDEGIKRLKHDGGYESIVQEYFESR